MALRCRTSDRTAAFVRGVDALTPLVSKRLGTEARAVGSPSAPRAAGWQDDLRDCRGCLLEAGGQVDDALAAGRIPLLLAGDCTVALTTLSTALRYRRDAKVLWLDAHGDFNTPATTESGYLSGMSLAGACGLWDPGLGVEPVLPERLVLAGVRDLGEPERAQLERSPVTVIGASLETLVYVKNALDRQPVYIHLDLDVIDPDTFPAEFPATGGLEPDKLYDLLEAVAGECEVIGLEVTAFCAPEDELEREAAASTAIRVIDPLLDAVTRGAHVSH
ncbi:MAG TPA: arginase family protein [Thermoleophilaceae bacterium]|nr:arginase family protein [Thermoleophilaceae bacterium]